MGAIPDSWWCSFHFSGQRIPTQEAQYSSEVKGTRNCKAGDDRERPLTIWLQASAIIPSTVQFSHPLPLSKRQSEQQEQQQSICICFSSHHEKPCWGVAMETVVPWATRGTAPRPQRIRAGLVGSVSEAGLLYLRRKWESDLSEESIAKHCVCRGSLGWSLSALERKIPIVLGHTRDSRREWRLCLWPASSENETLMVVAEHHLLHWLSRPGWKMILNRNHYDIT